MSVTKESLPKGALDNPIRMWARDEPDDEVLWSAERRVVVTHQQHHQECYDCDCVPIEGVTVADLPPLPDDLQAIRDSKSPSAPVPAVQAESTGGLVAEMRAVFLSAVEWEEGRAGLRGGLDRFERILADRLAARDAVQAREVAEARADERERIAQAIEQMPSPPAVNPALVGRTPAARLARAGGESDHG